MPRHVSQIALVPELLALADVSDVDLDHRERAAGDRITKDDRRVGQAPGIHDGTRGACLLLQEIDERAFVVRLERQELHARLARDIRAAPLDLLQRRRPVELRLALAQRVQVRAVHEKETPHATRASTARAAARS